MHELYSERHFDSRGKEAREKERGAQGGNVRVFLREPPVCNTC